MRENGEFSSRKCISGQQHKVEFLYKYFKNKTSHGSNKKNLLKIIKILKNIPKPLPSTQKNH